MYQDCQYQSGMKTDYTDHINAVHIRHPHALCSICGALFKTKKKLGDHLGKLHEDFNTKKKGRGKMEEEFIDYSTKNFFNESITPRKKTKIQ